MRMIPKITNWGDAYRFIGKLCSTIDRLEYDKAALKKENRRLKREPVAWGR